MKIGLIDVDGHRWPNLALMRISTYHKSRGDEVEWWWSDFVHYDIVYMSKVFSDAYTKDVAEPINADKVIKGGSGYAISLVNGKEVYDKSKDADLPKEIETCFPDYGLYPQYDFAISMTSRGCPRGCPFCVVGKKEGRCAIKVADVSDFWNGQSEIRVLDPNITACADKRDLLSQYRATNAYIDFSQGLDIRLLDDADIDDINHMKMRNLHFAWDNAKEDLVDRFAYYAKHSTRKTAHGAFATVYMLTNFNSSIAEDLYRVYTLRDLGYDPYVMIYNKPSAPKAIRDMAQWVNNRIVFKTVDRFEDYVQNQSRKSHQRHTAMQNENLFLD